MISRLVKLAIKRHGDISALPGRKTFLASYQKIHGLHTLWFNLPSGSTSMVAITSSGTEVRKGEIRKYLKP
jgi:hypothetical protein